MRQIILLTLSLAILSFCSCQKVDRHEKLFPQYDRIVKIVNTSSHTVSIDFLQQSYEIQPSSSVMFKESDWVWYWQDQKTSLVYDTSDCRVFLTDSITLIFDGSVRIVHTQTDYGYVPQLHNLFDISHNYMVYSLYGNSQNSCDDDDVNKYTIMNEYTITDNDYYWADLMTQGNL